MNESIKKSLVLGFIGATAALLLAIVNHFTEPIVKNRSELELRRMLSSLSQGQEIGLEEPNPGKGINRRWALENEGWILEITASGYGGPMIIVASFLQEGTLQTARLMSNNETPGFGKRAETPEYMEVFSGRGGKTPLPAQKIDLSKGADMVTGATITFKSISSALINASNQVKQWRNP